MKTAPLTTRGNRSPPFVIVGLVVALCIMSFYYWRISSRNSELEMQLETQRTVIRNEISKRGNSEKRTDTVMANLKACEDDMQKDKMILIEKENNIKSLNDQLHAKTEEAENKNKECDTNLKKCQDDTNGVRQELQKLKEDAAKREEELKSLKDAASPNQNCNCEAALQEQRKNIENVLLKTVGEQAVTALRQNDQGKAAGDAQAPQQPQQQPAQPQAQQQAPPQPAAGGEHIHVHDSPGDGGLPDANRFDKNAKDGLIQRYSSKTGKVMPRTSAGQAGIRVPITQMSAKGKNDSNRTFVGQRQYVNRFGNMLQVSNQRNRNGRYRNADAAAVAHANQGAVPGKLPVDGQGGLPTQEEDRGANAANPAAANGEAGIRHGADNANAIDTAARNKDTADREGKDGVDAKDADVNDETDADADGDVVGKKVIDDAPGGGPLKFEPRSTKESDDEIDDLGDN